MMLFFEKLLSLSLALFSGVLSRLFGLCLREDFWKSLEQYNHVCVSQSFKCFLKKSSCLLNRPSISPNIQLK